MKQLYYVLLASFSLTFLLACKKDKLKGDKEILEGRWKWEYSFVGRNTCDHSGGWTEKLTPQSENMNYTFKFLKKGKIIFYENEVEIEKMRIVFADWSKCQNNNDYFNILLNNKDDQIIHGCVGMDTMRLFSFFPFKDTGCDDYTSYFIKVN